MKLEDIKNNPSWKSSVGEKIDKIHFRNGHFHAECDKHTGKCNIHYDTHDPHESIPELIKHLNESKSGRIILGTMIIGLVDQIFTGGSLRKAIFKI